jgi:hypothetical protein
MIVGKPFYSFFETQKKTKRGKMFFYVFILLFSLAVCVYVVVFFDNPLYQQ